MIELGPQEQVTAQAGLPLVVEALHAVRLDEAVHEHLAADRRDRVYSTLEKLEAPVLRVAAGGERIEDIRVLSDDKGLLRLLDRTLPSPDALLDFLGSFDDPNAFAARPADEESFVPPETEGLRALDEILRASVERIAAPGADTATIDHDGTIIESHKQGALVAYEGTRGYQPLVAVWAEAKPRRYLALRFTPRQQELFGTVGRRFHAIVSNRHDLGAEEIVRWHRGKAGTIEHVHRTMKDELGAGVLPSQRFGANAAWFRVNALTCNLLTLLRQHALPERFRRARPKRLRFEVFTLPARLIQHGREITVRVSASPQRAEEIGAARRWLLARHAAPTVPVAPPTATA